MIAPASPGGECRATSASCTPFQPIAVSAEQRREDEQRRSPVARRDTRPSRASTRRRRAPSSPSSDARPDASDRRARPTAMRPADAAEGRDRKCEPRRDQRPAQRLGQVHDEEAHQRHLQRRIEERDDRQLARGSDSRTPCEAAAACAAIVNLARGRASRPGRTRIGCAASATTIADAGEREQRPPPAERERERGKHRAAERCARRDAGLLDRERERHARRRRGAREDLRRRRRDRSVARADDQRRRARAAP